MSIIGNWIEKNYIVLIIFFGIIGTPLILGLFLGRATDVWHPYTIPSSGMEPSVPRSNYIIGSRVPYMLGSPQRGDIIIFHLPKAKNTQYVKRLIGLPGDTIQMRGGRLYINQKLIPKQKTKPYVLSQPDGKIVNTPRFKETLPNGVTYTVLDIEQEGPLDNTPVFKVPQNDYFVMGDNRDNSTDSRSSNAIGFVPEENIVGKVIWRFRGE